MSLATHVVLCLDVDDALRNEDEILAQMPNVPRRGVELLRLSQFGAPPTNRLGAGAGAVDWTGLAHAVVKLAAGARVKAASVSPPVEFFVVGAAPLALFVLLGAELSAWAKPQTILNRRKDGVWDRMALDAEPGARVEGVPARGRYFDAQSGLDSGPLDATGTVALFISAGQSAPRPSLVDFTRKHGAGIAGVVECRSAAATPIDANNAAGIADELVQFFAAVQRTYPNATGVALFVAGPASLAFMVGRAFNPKALGTALVANFVPPGGYELALAMPWKGATRVELSRAPEHELARREVLREALRGIDDLRKSLALEDLPPMLAPEERAAVLTRLKELEIAGEPVGEEFSLSVAFRRMSIGSGLLEAMRGVEQKYWAPFAQQMLLHELFHVDQQLSSVNFIGVGRAGVALEEVDYWADVFATGTLASWRLREGGPRAQREPGQVLGGEIEAALHGVEAFDRATGHARLEPLYERRLRRYLIWYLQHARAGALRAVGDVWTLLRERLVVEIAPLPGRLDERFDKIVQQPTGAVELFVVLGGGLARFSARPGFDPKDFVQAVQGYDRTALQRMMGFVAQEQRGLLLPWVK